MEGGKTKNPFLTPGTQIREVAETGAGLAEKTAISLEIIASLIPVAAALSFIANTTHGEMAQAAHDTLNICQGLVVIAGTDIIRRMGKLADTSILQVKANGNNLPTE